MTRFVEQSLFPDIKGDRAVGPLIPSVLTGNNDELIRQIAPLYLDGRTVLDVTYGWGNWWNRYRPDGLVFHDIALDGVDFTDLPYGDGQWDTVCYDPPYVAAGGDTTSTAGDFQERFGITGVRSGAELQELMFAGLAETARVTNRTDGFLLVKGQDVTQGGFQPWTYLMWDQARSLGLHLHDEIVHHSGSGPGGHNIVDQKRARRHHSKLLVFTWRRL